jgi:hypothetical protein
VVSKLCRASASSWSEEKPRAAYASVFSAESDAVLKELGVYARIHVRSRRHAPTLVLFFTLEGKHPFESPAGKCSTARAQARSDPHELGKSGSARRVCQPLSSGDPLIFPWC